MTSRILGVVREQVLAALFGAGNAMDAYNVAYRIPNLVRDLFAEGAMSSAFVPTFTRHLATAGKESAWRLANYVINGLIVITGLLVLVGIVFAEPLVEMFAGAYRSVPGKLELTVFLTRIMLPFLSFVAVAAACMGMLNSLHRFFIPALSPAMYNVATITCAFAVVPLMPSLGLPAIAGIAMGSLLGGAAQLAVQWPALRREGFAYRPILDWRDESLRRVLILMGPGTIGLAATQVNVFVNTVLATGEGTGAVSWLNYAFRLMYLPIGLFGISIATATLPAVSRHAALNEEHHVRRTVADGLSLMMMLNVPATAGLLVLAVPIVRVIFERSAFTAADTAATAAALQFYALGLVGYSVVRIASPVFYALGENRTPVKVSVATVAVNAALNIVLVRFIGYRGLALGTSVAALFNAALLMFLLRRRLGGLDGRRVAELVCANHDCVDRHGGGGRTGGLGRRHLAGWQRSVPADCPSRSLDHGRARGARCRRAYPPHPRVSRRCRIGHAKAGKTNLKEVVPQDAVEMKRPLGLHPTVLLMAGTHFLVDGFSNIYAPLLPLLIPHLSLSLAAAGTLQMCFLMANSVSQLAFGHIADRWRPRALLIAGPLFTVTLLPLIGLASTPVALGVILTVGGLGAAAFHPPAAALVHRLAGTRQGYAMSFHITGGSLGFSLGPLVFAPFAERYGLVWIPLLVLPALAVLASFCAECRR